MKKLIYFIFVLASACMVSCKQSNVETSKNGFTHVFHTGYTVCSKDDVAFNISFLKFGIPSVDLSEKQQNDINNDILRACGNVVENYNSDDIADHTRDILNGIHYELKSKYGKNPEYNIDSLNIASLLIDRYDCYTNRLMTIPICDSMPVKKKVDGQSVKQESKVGTDFKFLIMTKDRVEYYLGQVGFRKISGDRNISSDEHFDVAMIVTTASGIVFKDYKSSDIASNREEIFNRICNETNNLLGKSDSIKLTSITLLYKQRVGNKMYPSHIELY